MRKKSDDMIYKRCARCGKRLPSGTTCMCYNRYAEYNRYRDDDKYNRFYTTAKWNKAKDTVKQRCYGLDIYSLLVDGVIEFGRTVHHIEPLKDNWDKRLDYSNLIYLTEQHHHMVHAQLQDGDYEMTQKLKEVRKKWDKGVCKNVF